jgi:hypothetical protein
LKRALRPWSIAVNAAANACRRPRCIGLHSAKRLTMVATMRLRPHRHRVGPAPLALLLAAATACGSGTATDRHDREIPWTYGPTTSVATAEHARGTGSEGGAAIAKGWQCRLQDGRHLTVRPFQLASAHPLFGKVTMSVGLFDKTGQQLATLRSPVLTAENATFAFELDEAVADQLWDLVFWYRKD